MDVVDNSASHLAAPGVLEAVLFLSMELQVLRQLKPRRYPYVLPEGRFQCRKLGLVARSTEGHGQFLPLTEHAHCYAPDFVEISNFSLRRQIW